MTPQQKQLTEAYIQLSPELKRLAAGFFRGNKQDGEDSVQQLWLNLATTGSTSNILNVKEFIKASLYSSCMNVYTKKQRETKKGLLFHTHAFIIGDREYYMDLVNTNRLDLISKFTEQLTPRQQAVFSLLLQGKSIKEIATIQGNTYNTIKHNRRLVVEKLTKYFAEHGEEFEYDKISGTV